jgi:hypothetical protein
MRESSRWFDFGCSGRQTSTVLANQIEVHLKRFVKKILFPSTSAVTDSLPKKEQEWSIGIYAGQSPHHFVLAENVLNPVLNRADVSDISAAFVCRSLHD